MTQAYNLAILANAVDTSGKLNVGTNATGTLPLANGGTGTTNTVNSIVAGTGITTSVAGTAVTINATGSGTVTSVATGNGLQGGTITTTGTLSVACPTHNTVGSYCMCYTYSDNNANRFMNYGTNYSVGSGIQQIRTGFVYYQDNTAVVGIAGASSELSGTWKWMAATCQIAGLNNFARDVVGLACRVS